LQEDDPRVQRLEEEVQLWTPASHAMYTVWSIVQATDDIVRRIDSWLENPKEVEEAELKVLEYRKTVKASDSHPQRPMVERGKSGEEIKLAKDANVDEKPPTNGDSASSQSEFPALGDFDYVSYALERVTLFRESIAALGVI
jgi:hypothetical protein